MEITVSRSIFGRSQYGMENKRRKQNLETLLEKESTITHLYNFKIYPSANCTPDSLGTRPLPKCCTYCLPESQISLDEDTKYIGLVDCFLPVTSSIYNSKMMRMFPFFSHFKNSCNFAHLYKFPTWAQLEKDDDLYAVCPEEIFDNSTLVNQIRSGIFSIVRQLEVKTVPMFLLSSFIRITAWIYQKILARTFDSVLVHGVQIEVLKRVQSTNLPIVFIPVSRSKFDTPLLLWTLAYHGIRTPAFMSSHNVNRRLATYFGGLGGYLKVKKEEDEFSEYKYSSALALYVRNILRNGNNIMFTSESKRSRTGRSSSAIYGTELLRIIHEEYLKNNIEDVYFVPVSISYESLPDLSELCSDKCRDFSAFSHFRSFLCRIYNFLTPQTTKGIAHVNFSQPFCLREFHNSMKKNLKMQRILSGQSESYCRSKDCAFLRWNSSDSINSVSSLYGELTPLYPAEDELEKACFLDLLNFHIIYDAASSQSVLPSHLLAFILMKKFRHGIDSENLKTELQWLINFIKATKRDFGFSHIDCAPESILLRAMDMLDDCISCERLNDLDLFRIKPKLTADSLYKLSYYANHLLVDFMMGAIVATAVFRMCGTQLTVLQGLNIEIKLQDEDFIYHCRRIYETIVGGFLLHPPCLTAETALRKQIQDWNDVGIITLVMRDTKSYNRWEDQSDEEYFDEPVYQQNVAADQNIVVIPESVKVISSQETFRTLDFYRNLLVPYLDVYGSLAGSLTMLIDGEGDGKEMKTVDLQKSLLDKLLKGSDSDFKYCCELLNMETVKAFLVTCEDHCIIIPRIDTKTLIRYCRLSEKFSTQEALDNLASGIVYYITK